MNICELIIKSPSQVAASSGGQKSKQTKTKTSNVPAAKKKWMERQ